MKIWATSCLHLNRANLARVLERALKDTDGGRKNSPTGEDDLLLLAGDIVEPEVDWKEVFEEFKSTLGYNFAWVRGNNDHATFDYAEGFFRRGTASWDSPTREFSMYCDTGVNFPGTVWAHFHDVATKDEVSRFWGRMTMDSAAADSSPSVICTHYPLVWKNYELPDDLGPFLDWRLHRLLTGVPTIKHLVCGHVHSYEDHRRGDMLDVVPREIALPDRVVKVHLVSDHRERIVHKIWDSEDQNEKQE